MREKLNSNPLVQAAVIGILLLGVAIFFFTSSGGEEGEEGAPVEAGATPTLEVSTGEAPAAGGASLSMVEGLSAEAAPPPPRPVQRAWAADKTIAMLFVRSGGIDDRLVRSATRGLSAFPDVATFLVPARQIARYAAVAEGVGVERTPALVVISPRHVDSSVPKASVHYGFQRPDSVRQAVIDAGYQGRTLDYHP